MRYLLIPVLLLVASPAFAGGDKYLEALNHRLAYREAASYPAHTEQRNIVIGAERIDKDGLKRLYGDDPSKFRFYDVAVTNNSRFRIYLNRIEIRDGQSGTAMPRLDLNDVVDDVDPGGRGNKDDMREAALRTNLFNKAMPHAVLAPGETAQGVVIVRNRDLQDPKLFVQVENLKRVAFLDFTLDVP